MNAGDRLASFCLRFDAPAHKATGFARKGPNFTGVVKTRATSGHVLRPRRSQPLEATPSTPATDATVESRLERDRCSAAALHLLHAPDVATASNPDLRVR